MSMEWLELDQMRIRSSFSSFHCHFTVYSSFNTHSVSRMRLEWVRQSNPPNPLYRGGWGEWIVTLIPHSSYSLNESEMMHLQWKKWRWNYWMRKEWEIFLSDLDFSLPFRFHSFIFDEKKWEKSDPAYKGSENCHFGLNELNFKWRKSGGPRKFFEQRPTP